MPFEASPIHSLFLVQDADPTESIDDVVSTVLLQESNGCIAKQGDVIFTVLPKLVLISQHDAVEQTTNNQWPMVSMRYTRLSRIR